MTEEPERIIKDMGQLVKELRALAATKRWAGSIDRISVALDSLRATVAVYENPVAICGHFIRAAQYATWCERCGKDEAMHTTYRD